MHGALGLGQRRARHQPCAGVVEAGHGQEGVTLQDRHAQFVDLFGQDSNFCTRCARQFGKRKSVEAGTLGVNGSILKSPSLHHRPVAMKSRGQDAQNVRLIRGDADQPIVRQDVRVQKPEPAVLGRLDRGDIAPQAFQRGPQFATRLAENPPVVAIGGPVVAVPLGLYRLKNVLKDGWVLSPRLSLLPAEQVDDVHAARPVRQIAAVAIGPDRRGRLGLRRRQQGRRPIRRDDEAGPVQLDPRRAQQGVGLQLNGFCHVHPHRQVGRNRAALLGEDDLWRVGVQAVFGQDGQQPPLAVGLAALGHRHGDADGGAVAALDPGMVGHGEDQPHRRLALQVMLQHAPREGLGDRVGGDEAKAAQTGVPGCQDVRRPIPPGGHQVGRAEPPLPHMPQGVDIAVAQFASQILAADEGRVADDEVDVRPGRRARVDQADDLAFVGHRKQDRRVAVLAPWSGSGSRACDRPSDGVAHQLLARP
ncbi:hypothetical protein D3C86_791920 [compost metagenome]